jgi:hypothetical protein
MADFYVGLDLGQKSDFTAIAVIEKVHHQSPRLYHLRHLERFRLVSYPRVINRVAELLRTPPLAGRSILVIDATGLGTPVLDQLCQIGVTGVTAVTITGAMSISGGNGSYCVPKRVLVTALSTAIETGRLQLAEGLSQREALIEELMSFTVRINKRTGKASFGAERSIDHDDLVLAVALALWGAEYEAGVTV